MSWRRAAVLLVLVAVGAFVAGRMTREGTRPSGGEGERKVLYYVDPMNPAFRSETPGTAPCGMPLEPVYAEGGGGSAPGMPAGTVAVRPDRQQLIGLRVEPAERRAPVHTLRLLGRVAVDERRLYRLYSVTEGWIREIAPATTGSLVRKDETLAAYYSQEVLGPQQAYLYALEALDRFLASGTATPEQLEINRKNVRTTRQVLVNLGMPDSQIDRIAETRQAATTVELRAPAAGFVLARNVSLGQRFDRTSELYALADLSRVWVLADAFEQDAAFVKAGAEATVRLPRSTASFPARVSPLLPQFDAASRTLKVRLEVDNPGFALRPDMYVDVEVPVTLPEALTVPASAVLDSGLRKSVFVDRGEGYFEPRAIETGWRVGDRVEVLRGLMPGEKVVVSGNFLLDSESRMRLAGAAPAAIAIDPVCGMEVEEEAARQDGRVLERDGTTWFFCAPGCKEAFLAQGRP